MTEDELDLLASAYLDGEATPDEVALVERDPELRAMVAELRAVDLGLGEPPLAPTPLKEAHLAAARQAFEQEMNVRREGSDALAAAGASGGDDPLGEAAATPWWRSMPSWLPVAAVVLVVAGGGLLASLNLNGGVETGDESAEVAVAAADDSANAAEQSDDSAESATFSGSDRGAVAADAESDDQVFDTQASDDGSSDMADSSAASDDETTDEDSAVQETESAPVGPIIFDEIPSSLDGVVLPELNDPVDSPCFEVVSNEPVVIDGFVEAFLGQEPVELWIIERSVDVERRPLLVDADCLILRP